MLAVRLHRQLLEVGGEALEVLLVRHHADRLNAKEVAVPDGQEPHQDREVLLERSRLEVLVHGVEAGQQVGEASGTDRQHRRKADCRIHRVAATDPIPEAEHIGRVDAERLDALGIRRDCDEVSGDGRIVLERGERPGTRSRSIRHRLERAKRLRGDDEQRLLGVEVECCLGKVGGVDVRDEAER